MPQKAISKTAVSKTKVGFVFAGNAGVNICGALLRKSDPTKNPHLRALVTNTDAPQLLEMLAIEDKDKTEGESNPETFFAKWIEGESPRLQILDLERPDASGTGGSVELGTKAIEAKKEQITTFIRDLHILIAVGGLGGGTAAAVLLFLAEEAKKLEIPMLAVYTMPAAWEMGGRMARAQAVSEKLHRQCTNIVLYNDEIPQNLTFDEAWESMNDACPVPMLEMLQEMTQSVGNIINNDATDLKAVLQEGSYGYFGFADVPEGERDIPAIAAALLENPYQNPTIIRKATKFQMFARGKSIKVGEYAKLVLEIEKRIGKEVSGPEFDMKPGIRTKVDDGRTWFSFLAVAAEAPTKVDQEEERQEILETPAPIDLKESASLPLVAQANGEEKTSVQFLVGNLEQTFKIRASLAHRWDALYAKNVMPSSELRAEVEKLRAEIERQIGVKPDMPRFLQTFNEPRVRPPVGTNGPATRV